MEYGSRVEKLRKRMSAEGVDAVAAGPGPDLRYYTGLVREPDDGTVLLLPVDGEPLLVHSPLESPDPGVEVGFREDLKQAVSEFQDRHAPDRVAVDGRMWNSVSRVVRSELDSEFEDLAELSLPIRSRKDETEIERLQRASEIADRVSTQLRERAPVGSTEREVARWIDSRMIELGADSPSFSTLVCAGENGAVPHHVVGERRIEAGEPVVADFGCSTGVTPRTRPGPWSLKRILPPG
jgi:Xaa-Pro aminopeptidase